MKRFLPLGIGKHAATSDGNLAYIVAFDPEASEGIAAQTRASLDYLDARLKEVGSDKTALLQVTLYLSDIGLKTEMDHEWAAWIGPEENWPQRACIGVGLEPGYLIEIVAIAEVVEH